MAEVERPDEVGPDRLLTIPQAAQVLAVPESWLRERVRLRKVPHRRLGKHVRFTTQDLEQIVERAAQQVVPARRTFQGRPYKR
ncbi:helix-turn-helix domain-containing protein [Nocardiopsis sp. EMB25]|uniref:helix-turn-helix domain-containing protein n=1 Tax=Nocardiopsis sp. EMB25 TaxID=2835867 RepID=UPI002284BD3C|nr:helix-turn-helix domain-containing protein [Nocardiopsis sp. EMB25]MCY9786982.1 helix-turn-helix domain-containing protein [Nocardiopsis sp. EMB25]